MSELLSNGNLGELRYDEVNLCRCTTLAILVTCYLGYMYPFKVLPLTHGLTVYLGAGGHNSKVFPNGRACHCHCQGSMNSSLTAERPRICLQSQCITKRECVAGGHRRGLNIWNMDNTTRAVAISTHGIIGHVDSTLFMAETRGRY